MNQFSKSLIFVFVIQCILIKSSFAQINTALAVGSIPGTFNATPTGAATYSIPIDLPTGKGGVKSELSISYNSQGGNGLLGYGWELVGISAINRVSSNYYNDGKVDGVKLDNNDRFVLDGNRLILTSGTYGSAGSQYHTENETFSNITAYGVELSSGPAWFKVETKDGRIIEYGKENYSTEFWGCELNSTGGVLRQEAYIWRISKITLPTGSTINYYYDPSTLLISHIDYSYVSIAFTYESRPDENKFFVGGIAAVNQNKRLKQIDIKTDNSTRYSYVFNYVQESNQYSHLQSIVYKMGTGEELNPTRIVWGSEPTTVNQSSFEYCQDAYDYYYGDFNGDGKSDYIQVLSKASYTTTDKWYLYISSDNSYPTCVKNGSLSSDFRGIVIADIDGDGKDDILFQKRIKVNYQCEPCYYVPCGGGGTNPASATLALSTDGTDQPSDSCLVCSSCYYYDQRLIPYTWNGTSLVEKANSTISFQTSADPVRVQVGEFDGDGKPDYLYLNSSNNVVRIYNSSFTVSSLPSLGSPSSVQVIDFNGNGRSDLLVVGTSSSTVYEYDYTTKTFKSIAANLFINKNYKIYPGDFNGDGKTDILYYKDSKWRVSLSALDGLYAPTFTATETTAPSETSFKCQTRDINGDGKDDIIFFNNDNIKVYLSIGTSFSAYTSTVTFESDTWYYALAGNIAWGDFKGDGKQTAIAIYRYNYKVDLGGGTIVTYNNGYARKYLEFLPESSKNLVKSVTDGLGRKISIAYATLPRAGSQYTSGTSLAFPLMNYNGPLRVVTRTDYSSDGLETVSSTYSYTAAIVHRRGKGFLGFKKFVQKNLLNNSVTETEFELLPNIFQPAVKQVVNKVNDQTVSTTVLTNELKMLDTKRFFSYVKTQVATDVLSGITTTTNYTYDNENLGNLEKVYTQYGSDATEEVVNTYIKVEAWCKSKVQSSAVTRKRITPADTYTGSSSYTYFSNGLLNEENANGVKTTYGYDSYGNVTSKSLSGTGITGSRALTYEYDLKGRLFKETNSLSQTTEYTNDLTTGLVLEVKYPNGKKKICEYDPFYRLKNETSITGIKTTYTESWAIGEYGALTKKIVKTGDLPESKTWVDAYGRTVRTEGQGYNGTLISTNAYNSLGQLQSSTQPYYSGDAPKTTTFTYDSYGRVLTEVTQGLTTSYSYSGTTKTVSSPQGVTVAKADALGNVVESTVNGQKVINTYNGRGLVKEITPQWGAAVKIEYDEYGFQSKLIDPSAGTVIYKYNPIGEILEQTSAKGDKCIITYDNAGRVLTKTWPGFEIDYEYQTTGGGIGKVKKIKAGGVEENYEYDEYGRMDSTTLKGVGSGVYSFRYTFDSYNNLLKTRYPGGFKIVQEYQNGFLKDIKTDGGLPVWQADNVNADGDITRATLNSALVTTKTFDNYGFPTAIKTQLNGTDLQSYSYSFDSQKGNLLWRKDVLRNLTESFGYDSYNRLTSSVQQPTGQTYSYSFADNGNITSKTGVGNYSYNLSSNIYALTGVSGNLATIQPEPQQVQYTVFDQPQAVVNGTSSAYFTYGADLNRRQMQLYQNGSLTETWVYFGGFEEQRKTDGTINQICYVNSPDGPVALFRKTNGGGYVQHYILTDYLGSLTALVSPSGVVEQEFSYDPWGRPRNASDWSYSSVSVNLYTNRGYTFHEHLNSLALINMNGRMYDPLVGRFLSADNSIQAAGLSQNFNRYSYCLNNPLIYTDPSGHTWLSHFCGWAGENWRPIVSVAIATTLCISTGGVGASMIGAGVFGSGNLTVQAMSGNINSFGDAAKAFGEGAITGYCLGAGIGAGLQVPILSSAIKTAMWTDIGATALSTLKGIGQGVTSGDWSALGNTGKIFLGNFALNDKLPGLGGAWEGISRFSWEGIQQTLGYSFNQVYNTIYNVDKVSYFDGATLVNRNGGGSEWGMTLGNFIMGNEMTASITDYCFMHEYGHTLQSQHWGPIYGLVIAPWSGINAMFGGKRYLNQYLTYHDIEWYEMEANRNAASYFKKYYNVDWKDDEYPRFWPLDFYYGRRY